MLTSNIKKAVALHLPSDNARFLLLLLLRLPWTADC